jgi:fatty-acyl-CoA synthase/long-chain acyl-CoA synthetase
MSDTSDNFVPYVGEDLARARITTTTIGDLLLKSYDQYPDKPAIIFPDSSWTYRELVERAMRTARGLQALGVKPRDHVGLLMPTCPELVEVFFAVAFCGAASVLINARYKASELNYVVENADVTTLVTTDIIADQVDFVERLNSAFPDIKDNQDPMNLSVADAPKLRNVVLLGSQEVAGVIPQKTFYQAAETIEELSVHQARIGTYVRHTGMILYTSGTTSNPKGCLLSHEAIVRNSTVLGRHRFLLDHTDSIFSPLPLFHIAAMLPMLAIFEVGGTYLGTAFYEPGEALEMLEKYKVTLGFVPFVHFVQSMLMHPNFEKTDLSNLKIMNSCFAAMPTSVGEGWRKRVPDVLQCGTFGMTEGAGIVSTGSWFMDKELGFTRLGLPLMGQEVRIVDPGTGNDLPLGEQGEVLVRGFNLFDGYYRDDKKTAEALDAEGWYHSGDLGSLDESGHIMFHDRLKDMLKVGGENVASIEIESMLSKHPAVKLAQVVGVPDMKYGEVPAAYVELMPDTKASEDELIEFCKSRISGFKVPRLIRYVTEWPMSASKIKKVDLRNRILDELDLK